MGDYPVPHHRWDRPFPVTSEARPSWRRGQDGDTAVRILMPQEPPEHSAAFLVGTADGNRMNIYKSPHFEAPDAVAAQDAALATRLTGYDHDLPPSPRLKAEKRRDSMQESSSVTPENSQMKTRSSTPAKLSGNVPRKGPPAIIVSTETSTTDASRSDLGDIVKVPKELEVDGKAGFDPLRSTDEEPPKKTYLWKGKRYEVQGDEPPEWLKDVREVPRNPRSTRMSSQNASQRRQSSVTSNSMLSGVGSRGRQSSRRDSRRAENDRARRKSARPRRSVADYDQVFKDEPSE